MVILKNLSMGPSTQNYGTPCNLSLWITLHSPVVKVGPMNSMLKKILGKKMLLKNNDHPVPFHYGSPSTFSLRIPL